MNYQWFGGYFSIVSPLPVTFTLVSEPDVSDGVEVPPDVSYPPDDDGTPVVDDTTEGGD